MLVTLFLSALSAAPVQRDTQPGLAEVRVLASAQGGLTDDRFVDAAAGADGTVFALMGDGTIRRFRGGASQPSWAGPGMEEGRFVRPEALASAPDGGVYVLESGTLTVLDSTGAQRSRTPLPLALGAAASLAVAGDGTLLVSAVPGEGPSADAFAFCPVAECPGRALGPRPAADGAPGAREWAPGYLGVRGDTVFFASRASYRIVRYRPGATAPDTLADGDLLAEAPPAPADSPARAGLAPRATGLVPLRGGGFVYTAFFPSRGVSLLHLLNASGAVVLAAELPIYLRVEAELPDGQLVFVRTVRGEQLVTYRLIGVDPAG
jgi:hypothetical protein